MLLFSWFVDCIYTVAALEKATALNSPVFAGDIYLTKVLLYKYGFHFRNEFGVTVISKKYKAEIKAKKSNP